MISELFASVSDFLTMAYAHRGELLDFTAAHLDLVGEAILIAVALGVPLGIAASRSKVAERSILIVANVLQTIPSLALLGVLLANGVNVLIVDNRRAFLASIGVALAGAMLLLAALAGSQVAMVGGFPFMVLLGLGCYLPYVAIHTTIFERMIAMTRARGNLGFLMYIADAAGYLAYRVYVLGDGVDHRVVVERVELSERDEAVEVQRGEVAGRRAREIRARSLDPHHGALPAEMVGEHTFRRRVAATPDDERGVGADRARPRDELVEDRRAHEAADTSGRAGRSPSATRTSRSSPRAGGRGTSASAPNRAPSPGCSWSTGIGTSPPSASATSSWPGTPTTTASPISTNSSVNWSTRSTDAASSNTPG